MSEGFPQPAPVLGRENKKNWSILDLYDFKEKRPDEYEAFAVAERAGFEPANLCGLHAFQACALSQLRDLSVRARRIIPENL